MTKTAEVTVVMPAYNAARYVEEAVRSGLDQVGVEVRITVVDDGSTDGTGDIVEAIGDGRITLIRRDTNAGVSARVNEALATIDSRFVARMDADDISEPDRLARQIAFLRDHHEIDIVSSASASFRDGSALMEPTQDNSGLSPDGLRWLMLFTNPISNTAVCARAGAFERGGSLDTAFEPAEDYEYWCRNRRNLRLAVLPESLVRHRIHPDAVSTKRRDDQRRSVNLAHHRMVEEELGHPVSRETCRALRWYWRERNPGRLESAAALLLELEEMELGRPGVDAEFARWIRADVTQRLRAIWYRTARHAPQRSPVMIARWLARERFGVFRSAGRVLSRGHTARTPREAGFRYS